MTTSSLARPPGWIRASLTLVVGVSAAVFGVGVFARALADCDVGINAAVAALALVLWALTAVGLGDVPDEFCPGDAPRWWPAWRPI